MDKDAFIESFAELVELDPSEVTPDLELNGEKWDSLAIVGAIALIDEHFNVTVDGQALSACTRLGDVLELVDAKVRA
jgi:acyl carrier protein